MGATMIEKILRNHTGHDVRPGDIVTTGVDRVMIHDIFIPFVADKFEEMGFKKLWDPERVVLIYDHLVPASQVDDTRHFAAGDAFASKYGLPHVHRADGICHQLMTEALYVKPGDVVFAVDDREITSIEDLTSIISAHKVGDRLTYTIVRDGQTMNLTITLQEKTKEQSMQ